MSSPSMMSETPYGIRLINKISGNPFSTHIRINRQFAYKSSVLVLTYLAYMCYHLTRKPIAVVKPILHRNCSNLVRPSELGINMLHLADMDLMAKGINEETWCDYPPFDGPDSAVLLGYLDSAFLFTYGAVMFASGFVAERVSLRYFLSLGMLMSGIFCYLFGVAKTMDIHSIWYFVMVQALAGFFQTTGWPGVVTVVGRWFGKSKRGLIFGIWNSHTSIGNILGTLLAAHYLKTDWSLSFIVPGCIMGVMGFIIFLFLVDAPEIVGCQEQTTAASRSNASSNYQRDALEEGIRNESPGSSEVDDTDIIVGEQEVNRLLNERTPMLNRRSTTSNDQHDAIGFMGALRIPGVIEFSLCLFFSKLVSYTFLYWLPLYIQSSTAMDATLSADVSTLFDVGGIVGAIAAGVISDYTGMSACTCAGMLIFAIPMLLVYQSYGALSVPLNIFLLFVVGVVVNGPYALITTSVSAELGTHSSLEGNSKALATVTAIIDGTGSIGAAVGPLIAGLVSGSSWRNVFNMLVISDIMAFLLLMRLVFKEFAKRKRERRVE